MAKYTKQQLQQLAYNTAVKYGVPPQIVMGVIDRETGGSWNPNSLGDGGKSFGLMQIYTTAHPDYKGGYDPVKNIDYGVKLLAGLYKRHGSWAKAVERYNGAGKNARDYAADVMNNRVKKYADIVANMKGMPTDIAITPSNESGITGAAASLNLPSNDSRYIVQAPNVQDVRESVVNPKDEAAFINQALGGSPNENQYQQLKAMYLTGGSGMTYSQMVDAAQALGINPDRILQEIPQGQPDTQADRIAQKIMQLYNPQDSMTRQQMQMQMLQQLQTNNPNATLADKINDAYNQYNQIVESDPRLQNGGYYVDPSQARRDARANTAIALMTGNYANIPSGADIAAQEYQYNIANQAGVPYDVYMAAQGDRIKAQATAKLQQAQDLLKVGEIGKADFEKLLAQYQNIVNQDSTLLGKQIEQVGDIYKQQITNTGNMQNQMITNLGNVQTTGMTNAAKLEGDNLALIGNIYGNLTDAEKSTMANMLNIDKAALDAQVNKYQTDVQANTSRANTLNQEATKLQEINQKQPLWTSQGNYYDATANLNQGLANMYPTVNPNNVVPQGQGNPNFASKAWNALFGNRQQGVQPPIGGV